MSRPIIICAIASTLITQTASAQRFDSRTSLITPHDMVFGSFSSGPSSQFNLNSQEFLFEKRDSKKGWRRKDRRVPLILGTWQVAPTLLVGVSFESNTSKVVVGGSGGAGLRIRPGVIATREIDLHKTTLFLHGDGTVNPNRRSKLWKANIGIIHEWEIERNLVARITAQYRRSEDIYDRFQNLSPFQVSTNTGVATNSFLGSASLTRKFGRYFVSLGVSALATIYENQSVASGNIYTISARAGYWMTPTAYTFVESSYNWQRFEGGGFDSQGHRLIAGIGTSRFRLFKGEIFAGHQNQNFAGAMGLSRSNVVFGGRLLWAPTRYMNFVAEVDQTLGINTQFSSLLGGGSGRHRSVSLRAQYQLAWNWSASARMAHTWTDYAASIRRDRTWLAGVNLKYSLASNWGLALDYSAANVRSNGLGGGYRRHVRTLGATYRY